MLSNNTNTSFYADILVELSKVITRHPMSHINPTRQVTSNLQHEVLTEKTSFIKHKRMKLENQ